MRRLLLVVAVVLSLSACGGDDEPEVGADSTTTMPAATRPTATVAPTTTADTDGTATSGGGEDPEGPAVRLEAGALHVDGTRFEFGAATEDETVAALAPALGDPVEEIELPECGEGPLRSVGFPSLAVYFTAEDGTLGGWHLRPHGPVGLTTVEGIGLGSTRADLEAAFDDLVVQGTSLGIEFTAGAEPGPYLSGTLLEDAPDGEIDGLWSGMVCVAR